MLRIPLPEDDGFALRSFRHAPRRKAYGKWQGGCGAYGAGGEGEGSSKGAQALSLSMSSKAFCRSSLW